MKTCFRCKNELPESSFYGDRTRKDGLSYECKSCLSARKKGRDRRAERWQHMTPEQREKKLRLARAYAKTAYGRALFLRKAYQRIDQCDLTTEEIMAMVDQPCVYCGTTTDNRGLDRIDNCLPHIKGNVQTACTDCNLIRGNRFSVEEMHRLGAVVAQIKAGRHG